MELIAHVTSYEIGVGAVVFSIGVCVGTWLAYVVHGRIAARRH